MNVCKPLRPSMFRSSCGQSDHGGAESVAGNQRLRPLRIGTDPVVGQFVRYAFIGIMTNVTGYLLYLWLTFRGLDPKAAATLSFAWGVAAGFVLNRSWTFRDGGHPRRTLPYYIAAYSIAYAANILGLYVFVDILRYRHEIVQVLLILSLACCLFLAQKFWIFSGRRVGEPAR